jgi:hypothetical protein
VSSPARRLVFADQLRSMYGTVMPPMQVFSYIILGTICFDFNEKLQAWNVFSVGPGWGLNKFPCLFDSLPVQARLLFLRKLLAYSSS